MSIKKEDLDLILDKLLSQFNEPITKHATASYIAGDKTITDQYAIKFDFPKTKSASKKYLKERMPLLQKTLHTSTSEYLQDKLTRAMDEGWDFNKFWEEVKTRRAFNKKRAEVIWRTERQYAFNSAIRDRAKRDGLNYGVIRVTPDRRTCPICRSWNEIRMPWGELPQLPLHPNCRCAYIPKFAREDHDLQLEKEFYHVNEVFGEQSLFWRRFAEKLLKRKGERWFGEWFVHGKAIEELDRLKTAVYDYFTDERKKSAHFYRALNWIFGTEIPEEIIDQPYDPNEVYLLSVELLKYRGFDLVFREEALQQGMMTLYYGIKKTYQKDLWKKVYADLRRGKTSGIYTLPFARNPFAPTLVMTDDFKEIKQYGQFYLKKQVMPSDIVISNFGIIEVRPVGRYILMHQTDEFLIDAQKPVKPVKK